MELLALLTYAAPVAYAALGETIVQRSGVINIGLEGSMLLGAFTGMLVSLQTHSALLGVVAAVGSAAVLTILFGIFTVLLASDQVVVGTAINLLSLGITGTLFRARFGQSGQLLTVPKVEDWHGINPGIILLFACVPAVWFLLGKTNWGLAVRAVGEYPRAAESAGLSVPKLRMQALVIGGMFAGIAGAFLSLVIAGSFAENMTAGRGFVAIAMVTFGRWRAPWVFAAALVIGFAESLQFQFQTYGWKVPFQLFIAMPYLVALLVLVISGRGSVAPSALGQPHRTDR